MHSIDTLGNLTDLKNLRRVLEVIDFPEGGGSIKNVYVSRLDVLQIVDRLLNQLGEYRAEQIKDLTWKDVEPEYTTFAEGCTYEMAPNPEEYVREYYPEKYEEWLAEHREDWFGPAVRAQGE